MFRGGVIAILAVAMLAFSSLAFSWLPLAGMPVIVAGPPSSVKERIFEPFPFEARLSGLWRQGRWPSR
jgi:hypothetical protein